MDCFGVESSIREIALMKGAQLGVTTTAENAVGYYIDHVGSAPILWVTADSELATQRLQANILPMIQASGLTPKIRSNDEGNGRKTGRTDKKLEWIGGGSLRPLGAQNANKFRQDSAQILVRDEIDGWPEVVGKDGDPLNLTLGRTAAFETSRKIFDVSTPTLKGSSKIERQFLRGDQRYYFVRCLSCSHAQTLRWRRENAETGEVTGIVWETDPTTKQLVPGSVRYLCEACGHAHRDEEKRKLLAPEYGAEWRPTAVPVHPTVRSYHLSALYSPLQSWESCVRQWLDAWDVEQARPKDMGALQAFYNLVLGEPFELRGEKLRFEEVSSVRRHVYSMGEVPNRWAAEHAGSPIQVLVSSVDVQKDFLSVAVFGFTRGRRSFLLDYWRFDGPTDQLDCPTTWGKLRKVIETSVYTADDGKQYRIGLTLVDSGYQHDVVYRFVSEYRSGVVAIKGEPSSSKAASGRLFHTINTPLGERGFGVSVDSYKERLHLSLKQGWDTHGLMPEGHYSVPTDTRDDQLKELTVERRVEELDPVTRQRKGWKWVRPSGSRNELLDISVYALCGLDMLAWDYCRHTLELDQVLWPMFWEYTSQGAFFTTSSPNSLN